MAKKKAKKKARKRFSKEEKAKAVHNYYRIGSQRAADKLGVHPRTIKKWVREELAAKEAKRKAAQEAKKKALAEAGIELECPHCGNDDTESFQHCEDVIESRSIYGFNDDGVLQVSGLAKSDEDGENSRLYCEPCGKYFPIPEDIKIDWV